MSKEKSQEYRGNGNHEYELVTALTYRLRVPGGWVYSTGYRPDGAAVHHTTVFVPMPEVVKHKV